MSFSARARAHKIKQSSLHNYCNILSSISLCMNWHLLPFEYNRYTKIPSHILQCFCVLRTAQEKNMISNIYRISLDLIQETVAHWANTPCTVRTLIIQRFIDLETQNAERLISSLNVIWFTAWARIFRSVAYSPSAHWQLV